LLISWPGNRVKNFGPIVYIFLFWSKAGRPIVEVGQCQDVFVRMRLVWAPKGYPIRVRVTSVCHLETFIFFLAQLGRQQVPRNLPKVDVPPPHINHRLLIVHQSISPWLIDPCFCFSSTVSTAVAANRICDMPADCLALALHRQCTE